MDWTAGLVCPGMVVWIGPEYADTPTGLTFDVFYRLIDLDLDSVGGGKSGTLKPALGIKIGYIFEGFWTVKEKSAN